MNRNPFGGAWTKPFLRIGHGGASGHVPANTLRSLALALDLGVDVVEFDVRPCYDTLVLHHDERISGLEEGPVLLTDLTLQQLRNVARTTVTAAAPLDDGIATLEDALDLLKGRALLNLDMKAAGYEEAVLAKLREKDMLADTLISSLLPDSLSRIHTIEPAAITGYSYPEDKGGASRKASLQPLVNLALTAMRLALPYRVLRMMAGARSDAVMLYQKVVSPAVVRAVHRHGGKVFAWTVDDLSRLHALRAMGVDGVASNHPDLFAHLDN